MKPIFFSWLLLIFLFVEKSVAQEEIQWASEVLAVSSEFEKEPIGKEYKAVQVLGRPNTISFFGQSVCAWSPIDADSYGEEWVHVGFKTPIRARQILIVENFNAGAVSKVIVYNQAGEQTNSINIKFKRSRKTGRVLYVPLPDSGAIVASLKVIMVPGRAKGYNQIDAIGITELNTKTPITVRVSKDAPKKIIKENLGDNVNTKGQEVAPIIAADGKMLYFTRGKYEGNVGGSYTQDVWCAKLETTNWALAENMGKPINNAENNAIVSISPDGRILYLMNVYRPDGSMSLGLSKSFKTSLGWSRPVECKIEDFYNLDKRNNIEFAISPKGNVMMMAVKRKDTNGDRDLYVSFLKLDSTWTKPVNMGSVINTAEVESAPYIAADNKTLYFTSYGHLGYGGGDIFVSRRLDDSWTNWSEPENIGLGINTPQWDGFLSIPASGDYAFMSSTQRGKNNEDIYRFKVFEAIRPEKADTARADSALIVKKTKKDIEPTKDYAGLSKIDYDSLSGEYRMVASLPEINRLIQEGYFTPEEANELLKNRKYFDLKQNLYFIPLKAGHKVSLGNAMFAQSKYELLPEALPVLDKLIEMMLKNPNMEVYIEGHTDNLGDFDLNLKLSQDRVNGVKQYFESKKILSNRIQTKAWGSSRPRASNETEESRKRNRRVEFTILKM